MFYLLSVMFLVLPLFLIVCINMIKQSSWADTPRAKVLIVIFYVAIFSAIGLGLYFITRILGEASDNVQTLS